MLAITIDSTRRSGGDLPRMAIKERKEVKLPKNDLTKSSYS